MPYPRPQNSLHLAHLDRYKDIILQSNLANIIPLETSYMPFWFDLLQTWTIGFKRPENAFSEFHSNSAENTLGWHLNLHGRHKGRWVIFSASDYALLKEECPLTLEMNISIGSE